jgi:hypothetical protein
VLLTEEPWLVTKGANWASEAIVPLKEELLGVLAPRPVDMMLGAVRRTQWYE